MSGQILDTISDIRGCHKRNPVAVKMWPEIRGSGCTQVSWTLVTLFRFEMRRLTAGTKEFPPTPVAFSIRNALSGGDIPA